MSKTAASLIVGIEWDNIPGRKVLQDQIRFDGTPEGFDRALEDLRVAFHAKAELPMRACGHPGPWATTEEDR
jgi:hypothetical protein